MLFGMAVIFAHGGGIGIAWMAMLKPLQICPPLTQPPSSDAQPALSNPYVGFASRTCQILLKRSVTFVLLSTIFRVYGVMNKPSLADMFNEFCVCYTLVNVWVDYKYLDLFLSLVNIFFEKSKVQQQI